MKKYILSFLIIGTFGLYTLYQRVGGYSDLAVLPNSQTQTTTSVDNLSQNTSSNTSRPDTINTQVVTPSPTKIVVKSTHKPTPTPISIPVPKPNTKPVGQYVDGIYTGTSADAYYGNIQVQATISAGKLTDVRFLDYPQDRSTSREINGQAMPYLRSEAIRAQSANVSGVSGATDSSGAFIQSLASALSQAKNI